MSNISEFLIECFPANHKGIVVEVGAGHPVDISISYPLRQIGWKIIAIEPIPELCQEFIKRGLPILQYAASAEDIGLTTFKVSPNLFSCSALEVRYINPEWKRSDYKIINVEAKTLNTILKRHHPEIEKIDMLIIDTEGWELDVIRGFDIERFSPKIVCLENFIGIGDSTPCMNAHKYKLMKEIEQDKIYIYEA